MRHQIRRTRLHVEECNVAADTDRMSRQMRIAEVLLTRMLEEPYYDIAEARYHNHGRAWARLVSELNR